MGEQGGELQRTGPRRDGDEHTHDRSGAEGGGTKRYGVARDSGGWEADHDEGGVVAATAAVDVDEKSRADGTGEDDDPWGAAHRTAGPQYPGTTMCSAFRTFQGWTALSDMDHDQGVLHTVPIPDAMGYLMLRPLLADVPDDDMCGVTVNQVFPANQTWHSLLLQALSGIPDVKAGDSVWWHSDMIHSVAPVTNQKGWGNVMYIPAAPWCPRNEDYASAVATAFVTGSSPSDFPEEHYERTWNNRFTVEQLNTVGRRGLNLG